MSMGRKDFEAIAVAFKVEVARAMKDGSSNQSSLPRLIALDSVATGIAKHCRSANSHFDERRFIKACGFGVKGDGNE